MPVDQVPHWSDLPGAELVCAGLRDLRRIASDNASCCTPEALLVLVGAPRLRALGIEPVCWPGLPDEPELALYLAIAEQHSEDAHSRYNALIRRLVSFERALEQRQAGVR